MTQCIKTHNGLGTGNSKKVIEDHFTNYSSFIMSCCHVHDKQFYQCPYMWKRVSGIQSPQDALKAMHNPMETSLYIMALNSHLSF